MSDSKEINIDEILTRSHKQAAKKKASRSKIIDGNTGEETTENINDQAKTQSSKTKDFQGMPFDFSSMAGGAFTSTKGLPLKQRALLWIARHVMRPERIALLKNKLLWPVWAILAIILIALGLVAGILFFIFYLVKLILSPYIEIFKKKSS